MPEHAGDGYTASVVGIIDASFRVYPGERLLAAARRAGVLLPYECGWGSCGTCKVTLIEGQVSVLHAGPATDPRDERRGRIMTCQTTPTSDVTIELRRPAPAEPLMPTRDHRAILTLAESLGSQIGSFRFSLDEPASYHPGQYAILELMPGVRRCYSMSGLPGTREIEFVAKRYEGRPGSTALFALELGMEIRIELPYGAMVLRRDDRPIVLIAGGTGVSPILALLRQLVAWGHRGAVKVVFGANTRSELVLWDDLRGLAGQLPDCRLRGVLLEVPPGWEGAHGRVPDHLPEILTGDERCYVAGPPPMVDATLEVLKGAGVSLERIHFDRFG